MFELLFKHILETRSEFGAYPLTHKLSRLLEQTIKETDFKTDAAKYLPALIWITICAEVYHYNFLIDCNGYKESLDILNPLLDELTEFIRS